MLLDPKGKFAQMIVNRAKPDGKSDLSVTSGPEYDATAALTDAAQKLISALDAKDAKAAGAALKLAFELCETSSDESESEG